MFVHSAAWLLVKVGTQAKFDEVHKIGQFREDHQPPRVMHTRNNVTHPHGRRFTNSFPRPNTRYEYRVQPVTGSEVVVLVFVLYTRWLLGELVVLLRMMEILWGITLATGTTDQDPP